MAYIVDVAFSPVNELMMSLYTYLCKKSHKRIDLGALWVKNVEKTLSPEFKGSVLEEDIWMPIHLLACQKQDMDVLSFIQWLERLTPGDIYESLAPWVDTVPSNLGEIKQTMVHVLSEWNEQYFNNFDIGIIDELKKEAEHQRSLLEKADPIEFGKQLTNGIIFKPIDGLKKILFIPQYHSQPSHYMFHYGGITICAYSPYISNAEPGEPSLELLLMTKALSDKSRLKIIKYLAGSQSSFIEVVRHMGLARSTVHDHLIILRAAGLIEVEIAGESLGTYRFRKEAASMLFNKLESYIYQ
ncbi:ArsR/SmtB family transcription factor [Bacillus sp. T33-2]|uniref:ArsR/SmtB family transcription factor n=1 Tax=Bacillus sp. T33-2 TaxID=2054168 RepID=UPI000C77BF59|nr:winged helix-turn-helix domain-containing protein [Bacillus sp. T33-2]PLR99217.1 transcriptional regulator [Bacillus sp. T33-2]